MKNFSMKNCLRNSLFALSLIAGTQIDLHAQVQAAPTVINMDIRAEVNQVGDAEIQIIFNMSAQQWVGWKAQYGNNPSLFKREMSKLFSQYEVTDFKLEQDDMNRQAKVIMLGKGMGIYVGDDTFELELEKDMRDGEIVEREYRVTYTDPQGPTVLSLVDQRIQLPEGAENIEITSGSNGKPVLRYKLETKSAGFPWMWIGILAAIVGAVAILLASQQTKTQAPAATVEA